MFSCPFVPHEQMIYFIYVFHLFHLKAFSQSYSTGLWCKLIHNNLLLLLFCFWTLLLVPTQILIALTLFFLDSFANIILKTILFQFFFNYFKSEKAPCKRLFLLWTQETLVKHKILNQVWQEKKVTKIGIERIWI